MAYLGVVGCLLMSGLFGGLGFLCTGGRGWAGLVGGFGWFYCCFGFCLGFGVFWYCFGCVVGFLVGLALCELFAVFAVVDVCVWSC